MSTKDCCIDGANTNKTSLSKVILSTDYQWFNSIAQGVLLTKIRHITLEKPPGNLQLSWICRFNEVKNHPKTHFMATLCRISWFFGRIFKQNWLNRKKPNTLL